MKFYDNHIPNLRDGKYDISVTHEVKLNDYGESITSPTAVDKTYTTSTLEFHVSGPRFDLDPSLVHSVYPPVGAKGDFMADLPSLVLTRSTLPWERSPTMADLGSHSPSWLFLLLVDEDELPNVKELNTVSTAGMTNVFAIDSDDLSRLPGQMNYLEIDNDFIQKNIFPATLQELQYLSYVRIKEANTAANQTEKEEQAVLLCNRLPKPGSNSFVYLISIENNYTTDANNNISFTGIKKGDKYAFPYLYKWSFHTIDEQLYEITSDVISKMQAANPSTTDNPITWPVFPSTMMDTLITSTEVMDSQLGSITPKITDDVKKIIKNASKLPGSNFHSLLSHLTNGFAPFAQTPSSNDVFQTGTVNLNYHKETNSNTGISYSDETVYYRGPLCGAQISLASTPLAFLTDTTKPISYQDASSFALTLNGVNDQTYVSAFELGRLTALNDADFSTEFSQWKNNKATALRLQTLQASNAKYTQLHLPQVNQAVLEDLPQHLKDKFKDWKSLKGIPYRYLVPNTGLLPNESLRYFYIDTNWINAFICGAFSIGHTITADFSSDLRSVFISKTEIYTGFLINSLVVSGWPDFEVDVTPSKDALQLLRKDLLDENIKIYIFDSPYTKLKFHLHPGKLHSGFLFDGELDGGTFIKHGAPGDFTAGTDSEGNTATIYSLTGVNQNSYSLPKADMVTNNNIVKVLDILMSNVFNASTIANASSIQVPVSHFAAVMLEGTPTVVFSTTSN